MISIYQYIAGKFLALEGFVQLFFGGHSRHFLYLPFECVSLNWSFWFSAHCERLLKLTVSRLWGLKLKALSFKNTHLTHSLLMASPLPSELLTPLSKIRNTSSEF